MSTCQDNGSLDNLHQESDYEKAEMDLLRDALKRSYKERFQMMTKLMKINIMLKNAKIIHKPYILDK